MQAVTTQRRDRLDARAVALMVFLCALWGLQQTAVKVAIADGLPPILLSALRSVIATILVLGWTMARDGVAATGRLLRPDATFWPGMAIAATFTAEFAILYPGFALTSASRGVLFLYTAPFFTALGAHLLLPGEQLRLRQTLGLAVAFAGVAAVFAAGLGAGSVRGDALCVAAAMLWAATTLLVKGIRGLARSSVSRVLLYQLAPSCLALLALSAAAGEWRAMALHGWPTALAWACLAYQGVVVAFASYLAWFWLVQTYPAGRLSGFLFLTPVFGVAFGGFFLGEPIGVALLGGLVAIALGLRLVNAR